MAKHDRSGLGSLFTTASNYKSVEHSSGTKDRCRRVILLVDMDYFFAACEELRHPEFSGKPLVVGADPEHGTGRGVVSTCNYTARKYGIHSAMPISSAYKLKPDAIFLPVDFRYYNKESEKVMRILRSQCDNFEQISVDEAFMDISGKFSFYYEALVFAQKIKDEIREKTGLPCSIGVSFNKLLAKMACESAKPNGIRLVTEKDKKRFLSGMPVGELYGVGQKTAAQLEKSGFRTIGDIAKTDKQKLISKFGKYGLSLYFSSNGIDDSSVEETRDIKSVSRETTFKKDTLDKKTLDRTIKKQSVEIVKELNQSLLKFRTVSIKIRYSDFSEHIRSITLKEALNDHTILSETAINLCKEFLQPGKPVRKIGVRASCLSDAKGDIKLTSFQ